MYVCVCVLAQQSGGIANFMRNLRDQKNIMAPEDSPHFIAPHFDP